MILEAFMVIAFIAIVAIISYACLDASSISHEQSEEDFKAYLEEKERIKEK